MTTITSAKLGDVASFVRGITFKPTDVVPEGTPGSVPCMRTKNVQTELDSDDVWSVDQKLVRRPDQWLMHGDTLVSSANRWNIVGKCCWIPELREPTSFGGFISVLRPDRAQVDPRYLFRWFASDRVQATVRSFGQKTTSISNLNLHRCLDLPLPLPTLDEQQRIATILDQADVLRGKSRRALANLDRLAHSVFIDLFGDPASNPRGWPTIRFGELLARPLRNGVSPSGRGSIQAAVLTLSAVTGREFNPDAYKVGNFLRIPGASQRVSASDLLICRGNGNLQLVGRGFFPTRDMPATVFPDTIIAAELALERTSHEFVQHLWNSDPVRRQIESAARTTNGTFKVNQTMLENVSLILPPRDLQDRFAGRAIGIGGLRQLDEKQLKQADRLFSSLQFEAFAGVL